MRFGRPRKMTSHQRQEALQRLAAGETHGRSSRRTYAVRSLRPSAGLRCCEPFRARRGRPVRRGRASCIMTLPRGTGVQPHRGAIRDLGPSHVLLVPACVVLLRMKLAEGGAAPGGLRPLGADAAPICTQRGRPSAQNTVTACWSLCPPCAFCFCLPNICSFRPRAPPAVSREPD